MRASLPVLLLIAACAGPQVPPDPVIPAPAAAYHGPVLEPCVLVHSEFEADRSAGLVDGSGKVRMVFSSILLRHPTAGPVIIDPAIGREKEHDFSEIPWIMRRQVGDGTKAIALADMLTAIAIPPESVKWALVTHIHYDHIGGAIDLPNAQVLLRAPDLDWIGDAHMLWYEVTPHDQVDRIRARVKQFKAEGPAYEGFPASFDVFGDGSVVGVPTPGHTPGSTSWFVNSGDGRRWLFVGDAAWLADGISKPAEKGWQGRLVDADTKVLGDTLARLHAFQLARPVTTPPDGRGVQVIVAHDPVALDTLPKCALK